MQITSWNVNSVRARLDHVLSWLETNTPDLLCLQEIKVQNEQFPLEAFTEAGWQVALNGQKTYNGVAFVSKHPLEDLRLETGNPILDEQKRFIACTLGGVRVYNLYVPNGKEPSSPSFAYKEAWYKAFTEFMHQTHTPEDKVLICGDFNVAPADLDVADPVKQLGKCCFHPEEHKWFQTLLSWGLTDGFRHLYPQEQAFSWWDYREGSFQRNKGMRIDHHLASQGLLPHLTAVTMDREERKKERPSDHIPVTATLAF